MHTPLECRELVERNTVVDQPPRADVHLPITAEPAPRRQVDGPRVRRSLEDGRDERRVAQHELIVDPLAGGVGGREPPEWPDDGRAGEDGLLSESLE